MSISTLRKIGRTDRLRLSEPLRWLGPALCLTLLSACEGNKEPAPPPASPTSVIAVSDPQVVATTEIVWQNGKATLQNTVDQTQQLRASVRQLLQNPTTDTLAASRQAWHRTHQLLLSFSVYLGIADSNPGMFGDLSAHAFNIDAHPIQPGFIDYFDVYQFSGIVNDIAMTLSAEALRHQHGITDSTDVSIGMHALEYLLWGEDGQRPVDDFKAIENLSRKQSEQGLRLVDLANNRRRVYLQLLVELLIDDCSQLQQLWTDPTQSIYSNYQTLTAGSRIELWRTAVQGLAESLLDTLSSAQANIENEQAAEVIIHNRYAGNETQAFAAQLHGLLTLLYGSEQTHPDTQMAAWLSGKAITGEQPALVSLEEDINQVTATLSQETQWPPTNGEAVTTVLKQIIATLSDQQSNVQIPDSEQAVEATEEDTLPP